MMDREWIQTMLRSLIALSLHVALLSIPTLLLGGFAGIDAATLVFLACISMAAGCEGSMVSRHVGSDVGVVSDKVAMRMASMVGLMLLVTFWLAQIEHQVTRSGALSLQVLGLLGVLSGIVFRVAAICSLGTSFVSDIRVAGPIVKDGIYAWMRHPSEVGLLLIAVSGPLLLSSFWTAAVAGAVLLPVSLWRMRRENAVICGA